MSLSLLPQRPNKPFLLSTTTLPTPTFPGNTSFSVQHPTQILTKLAKFDEKISALGGNLYHCRREARKGHEEKVEDETI